MYLGNPDECQWSNEHTGELLTLGFETSHMDFKSDYVDYGQNKQKVSFIQLKCIELTIMLIEGNNSRSITQLVWMLDLNHSSINFFVQFNDTVD